MRAAPLLGLLLGTGCLDAAAVHAAPRLGGSLAFVSDYIDHGISLTCGNPAAQGDVHVSAAPERSASELFAGVWGSKGIGEGLCRGAREVDAYAGYRLGLSLDSSATLTYTHYAFPGGGPTYLRSGWRYDYDELATTWAYRDELYLSVGWVPNALRYEYHHLTQDRSAFSYGVQLHHAVWGRLSLSLGAGYDTIADASGTGYGFWNAGLGYAAGPLELDLTYVKSAPRAERLWGEYIAGGRVAAVALWRF